MIALFIGIVLLLVALNFIQFKSSQESQKILKGVVADLLVRNLEKDGLLQESASRLARLKVETPNIVEVPPPPPPVPELTGELAAFVAGIENEEVRRATEEAAIVWLAEDQEPDHVLEMIRGYQEWQEDVQ